MRSVVLQALLLLAFLNTDAQDLQWAKTIKCQSDMQSVEVDPQDNIYMAGTFGSATVTFGATVLTNTAMPMVDVFLVKYDMNGNVRWAKQITGPGNEFVSDIASDKYGHIYLAGVFGDTTVTFDTITLHNHEYPYTKFFIAKYDTAGNVIWAKTATIAPGSNAGSIAADTLGNVYFTGYFSGPKLVIGSDTLINQGSDDLYLAKFDASGAALWGKSAGGPLIDGGAGVAVDEAGGVYVGGVFYSGNISVGTTTLTNSGNAEMLIAKYDANGNNIWAKSIGGASDDVCYSLAAHGNNLYVGGASTSSSLVIGSTTLTNHGGYDAIFAKYDADGNSLWAKDLGGSLNDSYICLAVDQFGSVYFVGPYNSDTFSADAGTIINGGPTNSADVFLGKCDHSGNVEWLTKVSGLSNDLPHAIAAGDGNTFCVAGYSYSDTLNFGNAIHPCTPAGNVFLARYEQHHLFASENSDRDGIVVHPNPVNDMITIDLTGLTEDGQIMLTDIAANTIKTLAVKGGSHSIDMSVLPAGIYLIRYTDPEHSRNIKVTKQ